jgi:hypothetical protein
MVMISHWNLQSLRTDESKWYREINFLVTQFTSYLDYLDNTNYTSEECEQHFNLDASRPEASVGDDYDAIQLFDFGALLAIYACMVRKNIRERCSCYHENERRKWETYRAPF